MIPNQAPASAGRWSGSVYSDSGPVHRWLPWALICFLVAAVVGIALLAFLRVGAWGGRTGFPLIFWPLFPFTFFLLFVVCFVIFRFAWWGYRGPWVYGTHSRYRGYGPLDAREILKERYARGEISPDQLRQMTRDLDEVDRR